MNFDNKSLVFHTVLALACVIVIEKWKIDKRLPWLSEYTDQGNRIASVALAVLCTAAFHWRELAIPTQDTLKIVGAWAGAQWAEQFVIYQVGWKPFLQGLLKSAGLGPTVAATTVEQHTVSVDPGTGERTTKDSVTQVVMTADPKQSAPDDAKPKL